MVTQRTASKSFSHKLYNVMNKNARHVAIVVGLIAFFVSAALLYMLWMNEQNKSAQRYFGSLVMEYNQAKQNKDFDWQALLKKFESGYKKHSGSSLLPYYKGYGVQILLQQNKQDDAVALLDTIISDTQASPMLSLYQIERALVALDMENADQQKKAEESLIALANDKSNQFHDTALFYLGRYYWANNNIVAAREVWQKLLAEQADEKVAPSPWAQQVKEYLTVSIA